MSFRPDYVHCVRAGFAGEENSTPGLCGREGAEWRFVDVSHWYQNQVKGGRPRGCPECLAVLLHVVQDAFDGADE